MRIGIGYDIHKFNGRGPLKLGGVSIPSRYGLKGHSDADVLLHAIADALFGALGEPDLGEQFPSRDPRYRHADSKVFVRAALAKARKRGFSVGNLDTTVIADQPKLTAHKAKIRKSIGHLLSVPISAVSIKAKTTEGFEPKARGIAAQAVVLLKRSRRKAQARPGNSKRRAGGARGRALKKGRR